MTKDMKEFLEKLVEGSRELAEMVDKANRAMQAADWEYPSFPTNVDWRDVSAKAREVLALMDEQQPEQEWKPGMRFECVESSRCIKHGLFRFLRFDCAGYLIDDDMKNSNIAHNPNDCRPVPPPDEPKTAKPHGAKEPQPVEWKVGMWAYDEVQKRDFRIDRLSNPNGGVLIDPLNGAHYSKDCRPVPAPHSSPNMTPGEEEIDESNLDLRVVEKLQPVEWKSGMWFECEGCTGEHRHPLQVERISGTILWSGSWGHKMSDCHPVPAPDEPKPQPFSGPNWDDLENKLKNEDTSQDVQVLGTLIFSLREHIEAIERQLAERDK